MVDFLNALRNLPPVAQIVGVVGVALIWIAESCREYSR